MNRYDQLELNIRHIITTYCGDAIAPEGIFVRRERMVRGRNLSFNPLVEIECATTSREPLCDDSDQVSVDVVIKLQTRLVHNANLQEPADRIIAALKAVENLNEPIDVGALNDWTISSAGQIVGEIEILELTLTARLIVPEMEV